MAEKYWKDMMMMMISVLSRKAFLGDAHNDDDADDNAVEDVKS